MKKNCLNCHHLEYVEAEPSDPSGFCCHGREYKNEKKEEKHLEQLESEEYRLRSKVCWEPEPKAYDMNGKLLKPGTSVILYSLIGNQGSKILGVGEIRNVSPMNTSPGSAPMIWVDGHPAHHPRACVAIYGHHSRLLKHGLDYEKEKGISR